jgi:hypothetical protein
VMGCPLGFLVNWTRQPHFAMPPEVQIPLCFQLALIDQRSNAICNVVFIDIGSVVAACRVHFPNNKRDFASLPDDSGKNQSIDILIRSGVH